MRLPAGEFMRRFLLHVLPDGFHRIRHSGCSPTATGRRCSRAAASCWTCRPPRPRPIAGRIEERRRAKAAVPACPCCGGPMLIIERLPGPGSRRYPARKPDGW